MPLAPTSRPTSKGARTRPLEMDSPFTRAFDAAFGLPPEFCTVCCGPSKNGRLVVLLDEGEELGECEACGREVDPKGRSIGRLDRGGSPARVKVVYLQDSEMDEYDCAPVTSSD